MGRIVLGMGTSHSPQLSTGPEHWAGHGDRDSRNPELLDNTGTHRTYEELLAAAPARIAQEIAPEKCQQRHEANQRGIARLAEAASKASLDALIIIGDDQTEMFHDDNMPAVAIYWGEEFVNGEQIPATAPPSMRAAQWGWGESDGPRAYPVASDFGLHLIQHLCDHEFDVSHTRRMTPHRQFMGHAFGFVYKRILEGSAVPVVPILLNTYHPPNQPTPNRCYALGSGIRAAVEAWPQDIRVGVIASGGFSHFVIDEEIDGMAFKALREGDRDAMAALPRERLNSGTSEIRNWIAMAGASQNLSHRWSDYVPCYRSPAGTGTAMGFGIWA